MHVRSVPSASALLREERGIEQGATRAPLQHKAMVFVDENILAKVGVELFRELLRVYPIADVEDYFKGNMWKDDLMRTDIQLIYAHAREAGAPYPPPLKDVKLPEMPKQALMPPTQFVSTVRPTLPLAGAVRPAVAVPRPLGAGVATPLAAAAAGAPQQTTELRLIVLFVSKWKLDPTRAKVALSQLTTPRRRFVITHFRVTGADSTTELEQYIAKCEQTNSWAGATAVPPVAPVAPVAAPGALKRPLAPQMVEANKRPHMTGAVAPPPKFVAAPVVRPGMPGLVRPGGFAPRAVRPPTVRATMLGGRPPF